MPTGLGLHITSTCTLTVNELQIVSHAFQVMCSIKMIIYGMVLYTFTVKLYSYKLQELEMVEKMSIVQFTTDHRIAVTEHTN